MALRSGWLEQGTLPSMVMSQKDLEELAKRPWPQMFTVMIWMRDIFKNCPCQVLLEECGISANPRISTSGQLYDVIKSTLQNYYPHWPPLGPICESTGSYLSRPGNQAFTMTLTISALSLLLHHSSLVGSIGHPILLLVLRIFARSF